MWVGLDDTDGPEGGCTTWLATRILDALGRDPVRPPRLVRLAPMAPWKTRGNGAVAFEIPGTASRDTLDRVWKVVRTHAQLQADPGLVVTDVRPDRSLYEAAVTRILDPDEIPVPDGAHVRGGRGVLGALAALAWEPGDRTWEVLAYREPARWGTPRDVTEDSVRAVARACPSALDCWDATEGYAVMVPSGPDPVLWGLRGDDPDELRAGADVLEGEPAEQRLLWETNQATDDHLTRQHAGDLAPGTCPTVHGRIASRPRTVEGGHVLVALEDRTGRCTLAAFEPTKRFRDVVRGLEPGDEVTACGGTADGGTVNLEKLHVHATATVVEKAGNPRCCGRSMDSVGRWAGYRCAACRARAGEHEAAWRRVPRTVGPGWHQVPPVARRHLAKPLKRFNGGGALQDRARVAKHGQRRTVQGRVP